MRARKTAAVALGLVCAVGAARAKISNASSSGFTVTYSAVVASQPEQVWQAFTPLPRWWKSTHTWSGDASHLSLDAQASGCGCERW